MQIPTKLKYALAVSATGLLAFILAQVAISADPDVRLGQAQAQLRWCQDLQTQATTDAEHEWANHCVDLAKRLVDSLSPTQSPSVSASTTTSDAPAGCLAKPSQCGYPDATNTGVPAETGLTVVNGDMKIATDDAVVEGKEIHGCVTVAAKNVTIRKTKIVGACYYMAEVTSGDATLDQVEINCTQAGTGIANSNLSVHHANIHGCENGLDVGSDVTVEDSWIHDVYNGGTAHGDGIQTDDNGTGVLFKHNTIVNPGGTSAIITARNGTVGTRIENNLLDGGAYTVYCPYNSATNFQLANNRFGVGYTYGPMTACDKAYVTATGNVWDASGQPEPVG